MFYGLASGRVRIDGISFDHVIEDIQALNMRALKAELEITALSAHAYPFVQDDYWIMSSGSSMGEGYGPVLISRKYRTLEELKGKSIATPGKMTTASLLLKIFTVGLNCVDIPFDRIMQNVANGNYDAGLIIHEGQITYDSQGFHKVLDFGELWSSRFGDLPLPLGLDVVRKDLGEELSRKLSVGLMESIHYGYTHQKDAIPYALQYGRGLSRQLGERFVKMYVNEITVEMGERGKRGLELLFQLGSTRGLIPEVPSVTII